MVPSPPAEMLKDRLATTIARGRGQRRGRLLNLAGQAFGFVGDLATDVLGRKRCGTSKRLLPGPSRGTGVVGGALAQGGGPPSANLPGVGRGRLPAVVAALALVAGAAPAGRAAGKSANVHLVKRLRYRGGGIGTDTDFHGRFAYGGHDGDAGGLHIFDVSGPMPKAISFLPCPGTQNDVAVVRPGLVALGFHSSKCAGVESGVQLIDVRNPRRPKLLGAVEVPGGGTQR